VEKEMESRQHEEEYRPNGKTPASLVVTAAAYREFMRKNCLDEVVEDLLAEVNVKRIEEPQQPTAQI
jgi:phosphoenolpyruvate synthase/pyruvate phosphate dikinase